MSQRAVDGLRDEIDQVLALTATLTPDDWTAPSACEGWSNKDVIAHMGAGFKAIVDPGELAGSGEGLTVEELNDVAVANRGSWSGPQVREEYATYAPQALEALQSFQDPSLAAADFQLGDLGTFTLGQIADALCFDHVLHVHVDLRAPDGSPVSPAAEMSAAAIEPTVDWMLDGLPQMCRATVTPAVSAPVRLHLEGPGGRTVDILPAPGPDGLVQIVEPSDAVDPAAELRSDVLAFLSWATHRAPWRGAVTFVAGDEEYGSRVLDAIRVV